MLQIGIVTILHKGNINTHEFDGEHTTLVSRAQLPSSSGPE